MIRLEDFREVVPDEELVICFGTDTIGDGAALVVAVENAEDRLLRDDDGFIIWEVELQAGAIDAFRVSQHEIHVIDGGFLGPFVGYRQVQETDHAAIFDN